MNQTKQYAVIQRMTGKVVQHRRSEKEAADYAAACNALCNDQTAFYAAQVDKQGREVITKQYRIPKRFIEDHDSRECLRDANNEIIKLDDVLVRENKKHYIVAFTDAQAEELLSDADYYRSLGSELGWECMSLVSSARATYDALIKQGLTPIKQIKSTYY